MTFTLEMCGHAQWGDAQQVSISRLLYWSGTLAPEAGIRILDAVTAVLKEDGVVAPLSQGGAKALEELRKQVTGSRLQGTDPGGTA